MSVFFTSDIHGFHNNQHGGIISLCNRPFKDMDEMMHTIISNHNAIVTNDDTTYDLGDVAYRCHPGEVVELLKQLNGKRIIIWGNHDKPLHEALKKGMLKDLIKSGKLELIGDPYPCQPVYTIEINGYGFCLSHYALRSWPHAFRGCIHLFAHSHSKLAPLYRSRDVGVDGHNFTPWAFKEITDWADSVGTEFKEDPKKYRLYYILEKSEVDGNGNACTENLSNITKFLEADSIDEIKKQVKQLEDQFQEKNKNNNGGWSDVWHKIKFDGFILEVNKEIIRF